MRTRFNKAGGKDGNGTKDAGNLSFSPSHPLSLFFVSPLALCFPFLVLSRGIHLLRIYCLVHTVDIDTWGCNGHIHIPITNRSFAPYLSFQKAWVRFVPSFPTIPAGLVSFPLLHRYFCLRSPILSYPYFLSEGLSRVGRLRAQRVQDRDCRKFGRCPSNVHIYIGRCNSQLFLF